MPTQSHIPRLVLTLAFALTLTSTTRLSACACANPDTPAAVSATVSAPSKKDAPVKHPLKGIVTDLLPAQSALLVKHEAIPGVMKAMTMMFIVDPAVLQNVKKGDAITALMFRRDGEWRLDEVKVTTPIPST